MKKSRLNRRINAVRKNIVVKKDLLNKLEKIKRNRKSQRRRTPKRSIKKMRRNRNRRNQFIHTNSLQLPYKRKLSRNRNKLYNNKNICKFRNFHEEDIEIPETYPGDLWVHNNLLANRDKPLEYFEEDYLKDVYSDHRKICYGIN